MSQKFPKYLQHKNKVIGIEVECFVFGIIASYFTSIFIHTNKVILFLGYLVLSVILKNLVEKGLLYKLTIQSSEFEINE